MIIVEFVSIATVPNTDLSIICAVRSVDCHEQGYNQTHRWNGSLAAVETNSNPMTALGRKADTLLGRMSALTNTGRSFFKEISSTK